MDTVDLTQVLNIRNQAGGRALRTGTSDNSKEAAKSKETERKVQRILNKLRSGKKLSPGELEYLEKNAPAVYAKALKITRERVQLEERMKNAKSKEAVADVLQDALNTVDALSMGDADETMIRINQYTDAFQEMKKTGEYQELPNTVEEEKRERKGDTGKNAADTEKNCSFFLYGRDMDLQEKEEQDLTESFYARG